MEIAFGNRKMLGSPSSQEATHTPLARRIDGIVLTLVLVAFGSAMRVSIDLPLLGDEPHHVGQVRLFLHGEWRMLPTLTTIPGYHLVLTLCARLFGRADVIALRLYSDLLSIAAVTIILALAKQLSERRATERFLQIVFIPILFPLFFFLYTDAAALSLFALALLLESRDRPGWSALASLAALLVRQNYIIWAVFIAVYHVARPRTRAEFTGPRSNSSKELWGYAICVCAFAGFVLVNHGVALGDREMHPFPGLYTGNLYFALALAFFLLLPLHLANARAILSRLRRPNTLMLLLTGFALFVTTFRVDHPYNQPALNWWLHNQMLNAFNSSPVARLGMFAAAATTAVSLSVTPLQARSQYTVYPFAILSLLPSWQIEPRYCLPALLLLMLFRVQRSVKFEWSLIAYLIVLSTTMFFAIATGNSFI